MKGAKDTAFHEMTSLNCKGRLLVLDKPVVMGILNATPDSFHESSRVVSVNKAIEQARQMLVDGAALLDIGGQSTRPGANRISEKEEMERVIPIIEGVMNEHPEALISIDTFFANVAERAIEAGAHLVNDISGGAIDREILKIPGKYGVPYVLMHMKGVPEDMQDNPEYENVVAEIIQFFGSKIEELKENGAKDIILDPGFGFGKSEAHNYEILDRLKELEVLGHPVMAGMSRKGMVRNALKNSPKDALNATTVVNTIALTKGAKILRVHDVREAYEAIEIVGLLPT